MNQYLESAAKRYPTDLNNQLIHPISAEDARIISELIALVKESDLKDAFKILSQWKYLKDAEIYNALLAFHNELASNNDTDEDDDGSQAKAKKRTGGGLSFLFSRNWIFFKDLRMDLYHIECYEKHDEYKVGRSEMVYQIIINPLDHTTSVRNVTTHKVINYDNEEQRDKDFLLLDNYMSSFPGIRFINSRDND